MGMGGGFGRLPPRANIVAIIVARYSCEFNSIMHARQPRPSLIGA
jgi:hypothetical protein